MINSAFIKGFLEKLAAWMPAPDRARRLGAANIQRIRSTWAARKAAHGAPAAPAAQPAAPPAAQPAAQPEPLPRILPADPPRAPVQSGQQQMLKTPPTNFPVDMTFAGQSAPAQAAPAQAAPAQVSAPAPSAAGPAAAAQPSKSMEWLTNRRRKNVAPSEPANPMQQQAARRRAYGQELTPGQRAYYFQGKEQAERFTKTQAFTAGFIDELVKFAMESWRGQIEKSQADIQKRYSAELSRIWDEDVPRKLLAAVKKRFPKFQEAAKTQKVQHPALAKTAETDSILQKIVHHPITQAIGYGALAGEGAYALSREAPHFFGKGPRTKWLTQKADKPWGRRFGLGSLGLSTAFLGAEGLSALVDLLKKPAVHTMEPPKVKVAPQPPDLPNQATAMVKNRRIAGLHTPKIPDFHRATRGL